jgi:hypothetical protein
MTKLFDDCVPATGFFLYTNYRLHVCAPPALTSSTTGLPEPNAEHIGCEGRGQLMGAVGAGAILQPQRNLPAPIMSSPGWKV